MENKKEILKRVCDLVDELNYANNRYYVHNDPIMSDQEFDFKLKELQALERENPDMCLVNSPTFNIGSDLYIQREFEQCTRKRPMGSIENCYDLDILRKWLSKFPNETYIIEWKKDGISCSLKYKAGVLYEGSTRGDGYTGDIVTNNIRTINSVPKNLIGKNIPYNIEVRGEILMPHDKFNELNKEKLANNEKPFANCRNATAGSVKQLDPNITKRRGLIFIPYSIYVDNETNDPNVNEWINTHLNTQSSCFETLKALGFIVDDYFITDNIDVLINHINVFKEQKKRKQWDNDGLVIKINSIESQERIGYTNKNPKYALAYKWTVEYGSSKILDIEWQVGRTGKLTPVAKIEPIEVEGSVISNVMLNNIDFIKEKRVAIGAYYYIYKGGSVIPVLYGPDYERNALEGIEIQ